MTSISQQHQQAKSAIDKEYDRLVNEGTSYILGGQAYAKIATEEEKAALTTEFKKVIENGPMSQDEKQTIINSVKARRTRVEEHQRGQRQTSK